MNIYRLDSYRILAVTGFISVCSLLFFSLKAGEFTWWLLLCPIPAALGALLHKLLFTENLIVTPDTIARQGFFYDERISLKTANVKPHIFLSKGGIPSLLRLQGGGQSLVIKLMGPEENWDFWPVLRNRLHQHGHLDINRALSAAKPGDMKSFHLPSSDWLSLIVEVTIYSVSVVTVALPLIFG